jgi:hypothetical protein
VGALPPLIARTVDVDELVRQWRELRAREQAARELRAREQASRAAEVLPVRGARGPRPSWWRRLLGRS